MLKFFDWLDVVFRLCLKRNESEIGRREGELGRGKSWEVIVGIGILFDRKFGWKFRFGEKFDRGRFGR